MLYLTHVHSTYIYTVSLPICSNNNIQRLAKKLIVLYLGCSFRATSSNHAARLDQCIAHYNRDEIQVILKASIPSVAQVFQNPHTGHYTSTCYTYCDYAPHFIQAKTNRIQVLKARLPKRIKYHNEWHGPSRIVSHIQY